MTHSPNGIPTQSKSLGIVLLALLMAAPAARAQQQDVVMKAMRDELTRSVAQLHLEQMEKPYFIAYRVDEVADVSVSSTLGALTDSRSTHNRLVGVEVRVGDYSLDNSNYLSFQSFAPYMSRMNRRMGEAPLDDNYQEIRRELWLATDAEYKKAIEDLTGKRSALQNSQRTEELTDFSKEQPARISEPPSPATADIPALEQLAREASALFREMPQVMTSSVEIGFRNDYVRYLNSEGTAFTRSEPLIHLVVRAAAQAPDGLPLKDEVAFYGRSPSDLPTVERIKAAVRELGERLGKLRQAAVADRYSGPVLFEDRAAAEVFAQVFAPGLAAVRPPTSDNAQFEMAFQQLSERMGGSFQDRIGSRVLPDFVTLVDDPLREEYAGTKLVSSYKVDDDGVPSRETRLVEKGILKTLLTARTPVQSINHSSGNHRGMGVAPGTLILSSEKTASNQELRLELLRRAKLRGYEYGIVVRQASSGGGLEALMRMASMFGGGGKAPSSALLEVYKVFPDGHEELLRGAEPAELAPAMFKDVVAVGSTPVVYTDVFVPKVGAALSFGMAATGMGGPPLVSYVVPSLLFDEVTLKKVTGPFPKPPVSKAPLFDH